MSDDVNFKKRVIEINTIDELHVFLGFLSFCEIMIDVIKELGDDSPTLCGGKLSEDCETWKKYIKFLLRKKIEVKDEV